MRKKMIMAVTVLSAAAFAVMAIAPAPAAAEEVDLTAKLQKMVEKLSSDQQAALYLLLSELSAGGGEGKAAAKKEKSPEEAFKANLDKFLSAAKDLDLDAVMGMISEDFDYYQVGGKEDLRNFLQSALDSGVVDQYIGDVEIITDDTEFEIEDDTVTIYPIEVTGPMGSVTVELYAREEDDGWKVTGLDIFGI